MAYEQKEGDIAIFAVKQKKSERGPDYTGRALIDGQEKEISLWIKTDTLMAGIIKDKFIPDFERAKEAVSQTPPAKDDFEEDEIPF